MIIIIAPFSLVFIYDQTRHDVDVPRLCLYYLYPFFVEIVLTPAKEVIVITQCLESPKVCFSLQLMAICNDTLPIQAVCHILSMSSIDAADDRPQNILSQ
jgi:hypothetical protein